jgi:hypothetical protein
VAACCLDLNDSGDLAGLSGVTRHPVVRARGRVPYAPGGLDHRVPCLTLKTCTLAAIRWPRRLVVSIPLESTRRRGAITPLDESFVPNLRPESDPKTAGFSLTFALRAATALPPQAFMAASALWAAYQLNPNSNT